MRGRFGRRSGSGSAPRYRIARTRTMEIELINTGSELMLGRVLNTHQQWICRRLADHGYTVGRQVAVADTGPAIQQAVREALARSDWVITTGGLGPTSDDLTRDLIAQLLGRALHEDPAALDAVTRFYTARRRQMPNRVRVQAQVPDGATLLPNANGTAPGLLMRVDPNPFREGGRRSWLVMLPGPPRELRPMFTQSLLPILKTECPQAVPYACRTLRTTGIPESIVEQQVEQPLGTLLSRGLQIGYCARPGEVDVRLTARTPDAEPLVDSAARIVADLLADGCFGTDDQELESVVVDLLRERRLTLAVAESCTGGHLANRITDVPGASQVLRGGWITYDNLAKQEWLGVNPETLAAHGAVSDAVAREMATGARRRSGADFALAITGIAGPTGGTTDKPVGTVFIALAGPSHTFVLNPVNAWDRPTFKRVTTQQALDLLRRVMLGRQTAPA